MVLHAVQRGDGDEEVIARRQQEAPGTSIHDEYEATTSQNYVLNSSPGTNVHLQGLGLARGHVEHLRCHGCAFLLLGHARRKVHDTCNMKINYSETQS